MTAGNLYTIGYQRLTLDGLAAIAAGLRAVVIDVRSVPSSRRRGFNRRDLEPLPHGYHWMGDTLGGRRPIDTRGVDTLRGLLACGNNLILMCMEHAPGDCHRHHAIARPHFSDQALHIYDGELILARDLQRAMDADDDYPITDTLSDHIRSMPHGRQPKNHLHL